MELKAYSAMEAEYNGLLRRTSSAEAVLLSLRDALKAMLPAQVSMACSAARRISSARM